MLILLLKIAGVSLIALGLLHAGFPKRFNWKEEFSRVSLLNRQMFYVHCLFLVMILIMMGLLCLLYAEELLQPTPINRAILAGFSFFWGVRMVMQWFVYSPQLWRGNRFNTVMHILFSGLWIFYTATFCWALLTVISGM